MSGVNRFQLSEISQASIRDLLRDLTGQAEHPKPPLGPLPDLPPSVLGRMDATMLGPVATATLSTDGDPLQAEATSR